MIMNLVVAALLITGTLLVILAVVKIAGMI